MQIVIDIDKNIFTRLFDNGVENCEITNDDLSAIAKSIRKSTPLPKGHGDLIDRDDLEDFCQAHKVDTSAFDGKLIYDAESTTMGDPTWKPLLDELKPIIEADKEAEKFKR